MKILGVQWFAGRTCTGIVRVELDGNGVKYFIGVGQGHNEVDDTNYIAEWGTSFPADAGDVLFGLASTTPTKQVQLPMDRRDADALVRIGMFYLNNYNIDSNS